MFAVFTGDLVGSTQMSPTQLAAAFDELSAAAHQAGDWHHSDLRFARHRGDGWQVYLAKPLFSLRTALYLRSGLRRLGKSFSTRISVAIGQDTVAIPDNLNMATSPTFVASGRGLEAMKRNATMAFADGGAIGACIRLADHISQGWTPAQAKAIHAMLPPSKITRTLVAQDLGISRQAVEQALDAAGFAALNDALLMIEQAPVAQAKEPS